MNLTNSYDKPEQNENSEKMKELGKFAKVNIPEFDEKVCAKCIFILSTHSFLNFILVLILLAN